MEGRSGNGEIEMETMENEEIGEKVCECESEKEKGPVSEKENQGKSILDRNKVIH